MAQIILANNIKMDKSYKNILDYGTQGTLALVNSNAIASANNYTFIRNRGTISTGFTYSQCINSNYVAFQNTDYDGKWFFGWIDDVTYISDGCTEIKYTVDSMSTWWDNWTWQATFVEREHSSTDYIGYSRTAEPVSVDNYITTEIADIPVPPTNVMALFTEARKVVGGTITFISPYQAYSDLGQSVPFIDGLPVFLWRVPVALTPNGCQQLLEYYDQYVRNGKADDLLSVFTYYESNATPSVAVSIEKHDYIGDLVSGTYYPKNKKLLQYPFVKVGFSNMNGSTNELRQEDFTGNIEFKVIGVAGYNGQTIAFPHYYKGIADNTDFGLVINNYPEFPMTKDSYATWLANNGLSLTMGALAGATGIASSIITGNVMGAIAGAGVIGSQINQMHVASISPDSVVGRSGGNALNVKLDNFNYQITVNTIHPRLAESIDDFFTRYGYATNELKVPNYTGRTYFNYIKISNDSTIGNGSVPAMYMEEINNAFRSGCTIWHNHDTLGNYDVDNSL